MHTVTAVAHRGDPYRFRENTLSSLRAALDRGADAVEIDVRVTRDGVPVLLHDDTLERLWGDGRALAELTAGEVRDLTGGGVPALATALMAPQEWASQAAERAPGAPLPRVLIDLPGAGPAAVRRIVGVVRDAGAADRVYYCGAASSMLAVRAADPAAEIALTWTTYAPPRPALLAAVRPRWLNYRHGLVDRALTERVHDAGLLLGVWTPDTARCMRRLVASGVDAITTNRVGTLRGLLERGAPVTVGSS
ncbi:glycerophosphodiester phosphodiesterase [Streptomyces odontomachi]|uniref:glycerophosphodiester phosphodiesterase n=1 Tax=Streptomyces odontomachi TaxID=2944940 RepID=UPI00210B2A5D|nr:glycerophosphodiester phosphodiesterase family protein [Streptomyces sp. ODS25]